jgi:nicotinate-nucleotide pyrophosphorylase
MTTDLSHILEELRSQRIAQTDLMRQMADVCGEVRTLVSELRHIELSYNSISQKVTAFDAQIRNIQLENATNKPILDIAKSMYRNQWMTILAAIGAVIGSNWHKLIG